MAEEFKGKMLLSVLLAVAGVAAGIIPYFFIRDFITELIEGAAQPEILYRSAIGVGGLSLPLYCLIKSLIEFCTIFAYSWRKSL